MGMEARGGLRSSGAGATRVARWAADGVMGSAALAVSIGVALALPAAGAFAHEPADPHAHHHVIPGLTRTVAEYPVPDIKLTRDDGKVVSLEKELDDGRPVVLSFIYTSCTTVCPVTSATIAELQRDLGPERDRVHLVSISIDPEYDTPQRLREYGEKFHAGKNWQHYTGTLAASVAAQRAFNVYRGDKMSHTATTLLRAKPGDQWVRLDGFATADQLLAELHGICTTSP
jgi:protein SCO1/2